jgi:hypothetical protein
MNDELYLAPEEGDAVLVFINTDMVSGMRTHHEDAPNAVNHQLADFIQDLLDQGQQYLQAVCVQSRGHAGTDGCQVIAGHEIVEVALLDGQRVSFCAHDCFLERV